MSFTGFIINNEEVFEIIFTKKGGVCLNTHAAPENCMKIVMPERLLEWNRSEYNITDGGN